MWTGVKIVTAPAIEPVTTAEAKPWISVDASDTTYDTMVAELITACRQAVEVKTGRTFITTCLRAYFDSFPSVITANPAYSDVFKTSLYMELARPPIQSVTSIKYLDETGTEITLDTAQYRSDIITLYGRLEPNFGCAWPYAYDVKNAVYIDYKAGYGDTAATVPPAAKIAIKMLLADIFEHREANMELRLEENAGLKTIIDSLRIYNV